MNLRPYQEQAIEALRASYRSGHRAPVLVLPTGGGKTVVASAIIKLAVAKGTKVLFLAHRAELLAQTVPKLETFGLKSIRLVQADRDQGPADADVTVASVQTLATARWAGRLPPAGLVVIDECHHAKAETWERLANAYAHAKLLGLTATPQRGDGAALGDVFDDMVVAATPQELIREGAMVPLEIWTPEQPLRSGQKATYELDAYQKYCAGRRCVVFCVSLQHAKIVADEFTGAGVTCEVIHGELPFDDRAALLGQFRDGAIHVVCNVNVLTEGWDDPGCSAAILARRVSHVGTFLQMCGRIVRPAEGKTDAVLVDLMGAFDAHGHPQATRTFSLTGNEPIGPGARAVVRQCPVCGTTFTEAACPNNCEPVQKQQAAYKGEVANVELVRLGDTPDDVEPARQIQLPIKANWGGRCRVCREKYEPGTYIMWAKGARYHPHVECAALEEAA